MKLGVATNEVECIPQKKLDKHYKKAFNYFWRCNKYELTPTGCLADKCYNSNLSNQHTSKLEASVTISEKLVGAFKYVAWQCVPWRKCVQFCDLNALWKYRVVRNRFMLEMNYADSLNLFSFPISL